MVGRVLFFLPSLLVAGCVQTTVIENDTERSFSEHRSELRPGEPSVRADFRLEGRDIVGKLRAAVCKTRRTWETEHVVVTERRGNAATGITLISAGAVAATIAAAISRPDPDAYGCHDVPAPYATAPDRVECGYPHKDPTAPVALAVSGAVLAAAGLAVLLWPKKTERSATPPVPHEQEAVTACVRPSELDQLKIAVEIAPGRWLPIPLEFDGSGRADVPGNVSLPSGTSLPIVVLEVPRAAEEVVTRGQSLGLLTVP